MAKTSDDLRHELEITRERMGNIIVALERKMNPKYWLEEYPLPAVGAAFGAGVLVGSTAVDRAIAHGTADVARTPLHAARDGVERVLGAFRGGVRRHGGDGAAHERVQLGGAFMPISQQQKGNRQGVGALGDVVEQLTFAATAALISAGTEKLTQLMEHVAGRYLDPHRSSPSPSSTSYHHPAPPVTPLPRETLAGNRW